jgi:hypothetical protein
MLGLRHLGQAPLASVKRHGFYLLVKENFNLVQKDLRLSLSLIIKETFGLTEKTVSYLETAKVIIINEVLSLYEELKIPFISLVIKNTFNVSEKIKIRAFFTIEEFLKITEKIVNHLIKIFVREYFSLTAKLDTFIDGVKRLWERIFNKRGEY